MSDPNNVVANHRMAHDNSEGPRRRWGAMRSRRSRQAVLDHASWDELSLSDLSDRQVVAGAAKLARRELLAYSQVEMPRQLSHFYLWGCLGCYVMPSVWSRLSCDKL